MRINGLGKNRQRSAVVALAMAIALTGCASASISGGESDDTPIRIGASLPLTGPVADVAEAGINAYNLWVGEVNENGGLLGRQVEMVVLDDGFDQDIVVSNYTKLISEEKVDLLLGTFSSKLNLPASTVAERNGMLYVEPSGGAPEIFERGYTRLFFSQPGTSETVPDRMIEWLASLEGDDRPTSAAYLTQTDPNSEVVVERFEKELSAMGIETVYSDSYPADQTSFDVVADAITRANPDLIIHGEAGPDGVDFVRSLQKLQFSPKILFQNVAPASADTYSGGIGVENTEGIFTVVAWTPTIAFPGSAEFAAAYEEAYGATPDEDAAAPYVAAQVLQAAVEAVGSIDDQDALADWLHSNTVQTIFGPISWDERGVPQGAKMLAQWQDGKIEIVSPVEAASASNVVNPKPDWSE